MYLVGFDSSSMTLISKTTIDNGNFIGVNTLYLASSDHMREYTVKEYTVREYPVRE